MAGARVVLTDVHERKLRGEQKPEPQQCASLVPFDAKRLTTNQRRRQDNETAVREPHPTKTEWRAVSEPGFQCHRVSTPKDRKR